MTGNSSETNRLLKQAARGDPQGLGTLLAPHGDRLRRMVALRLDRRLQGRIDPSDVIQETCLEASVRLAEYLRDPSMPFFLWLRFLTGQKLVTLHRHHLGVKMRGAGQEVALCRGPLRPGRPGETQHAWEDAQGHVQAQWRRTGVDAQRQDDEKQSGGDRVGVGFDKRGQNDQV
jgi:DNA-directed RNA polymerase specialized sigma24 family protein